MPGRLETEPNISITKNAVFLIEKYVSQQVSYPFFKGKLIKACLVLLTHSDRSHAFWLGTGVGGLRLLCAVLVQNSLLLGSALSYHLRSHGLPKSRLSSHWALTGFSVKSIVLTSSHACAFRAGYLN